MLAWNQAWRYRTGIVATILPIPLFEAEIVEPVNSEHPCNSEKRLRVSFYFGAAGLHVS